MSIINDSAHTFSAAQHKDAMRNPAPTPTPPLILPLILPLTMTSRTPWGNGLRSTLMKSKEARTSSVHFAYDGLTLGLTLTLTLIGGPDEFFAPYLWQVIVEDSGLAFIRERPDMNLPTITLTHLNSIDPNPTHLYDQRIALYQAHKPARRQATPSLASCPPQP